MANDRQPHRKIADGIRIRSAEKPPGRKPVRAPLPADEKREEPLIVHSYSPAPVEIPKQSEALPEQPKIEANVLPMPRADEEFPFAKTFKDPGARDTNFARWFSYPRQTDDRKDKSRVASKKPAHNAPRDGAENRRTLSEGVSLGHGSQKRFAFWGMATGALLMGGVAILFSTVFARATVRVKPKIEAATIENVSVIFDTSVSQPVPEQKVVPAEHLHFTGIALQEVNVSATQYVEARARGIVRISNKYSTAPQRLVARTRFVAPSGVVFRLPSPVVIPGAVSEKGSLTPRTIEVELMADEPGEQANLSGEVHLRIPGFQGTPKYDGFLAAAPRGFSGGSRGMKKTAHDADMQQAQQQATKKAYDELKQRIRDTIPPGLRLVDGLQEIRIVKVDTVEEGSKLMVQANAEGDALVFHEEDVIALLKQALLPQDGTRILVDDSANLTYAVRTLNFERGRADVLMQGSVKTKQPLTQAQRDDLARSLAGKKMGSAREFFNVRPDVVLASISLFPPWRSALPSNFEHIWITDEMTEK